jgi:hypothetical protein
MDPPFNFAACNVGSVERREGAVEIRVAAQAVGAALDDLVQIGSIVERSKQRYRPVIHMGDTQTGANLQLGHSDAGLAKVVEHFGRVFELDCRVAQIQADSKMAPYCGFDVGRRGPRQTGQTPCRRVGKKMFVEECDDLIGGFEKTRRLGLDREGDHAARPPF